MPRQSAPLPISAYSICTAVGTDTAQVAAGLAAGAQGLVRLSDAQAAEITTHVGRITAPLPPIPAPFAGLASRQLQIALHLVEAMREPIERALHRWGAHRIGVFIGTTTGGMDGTEARIHPGDAITARLASTHADDTPWYRSHALHVTADFIAAISHTTGPRYIISTACSSSAKVFGSARRLIALGVIDAALIGGVDTLCRFTVRGFHGLGILASERCRPFSTERQGINIGEGGALLLVERDEGSLPVLRGRLLGVGESCDAHHMTHPEPNGRGARESMRRAILDAGRPASDIGLVNAHGTGTAINDAIEAHAIAAELPHGPPVFSSKASIGHLLGASGAAEAVLTLMALDLGIAPPSIGCDPFDETLPIDVRSVARSWARGPNPMLGLSNSFGFGGHNVSLILEAA